MIRVWDIAEFEFKGHADGNPFTDYEIHGEFSNENETKTVSGFYDGAGVYRIRFMPSFKGKYQYRVWGSFSEQEYTGSFTAEEPSSHGMVKVDGVHFCYSDGTPYYSIGTTCYVWSNQTAALQAQTLETLKNNVFNKIRFCIFPKHYDYNYRDPVSFPYMGTPVDNSDINKYNFFEYNENTPGNHWDFFSFNVDYFRMLEKNIIKLMELGIEADIILFHPYDRWGFSNMPPEANDLYLKYVVARFSAYRNVWWSLANEYDICSHKTPEDWEHYAELVTSNDPYSHLISIHNCLKMYDFSKPWATHCSVQRQAGYDIVRWLEEYKKPVVIDEMCYEGNIEQAWGNITPQEMLRRMWETVIQGAYPGHGECYLNENIWWSHGGKLYGESHKRFGFLYQIMTECGRLHSVDHDIQAENEDGSIRIEYYGIHQPIYKVLNLGNDSYQVDVIDTWNMTVENRGIYTGTVKIDLPQREYMALRWCKI